MSKKSLRPKDFAWVPIGYGVLVVFVGIGALLLLLEGGSPRAGERSLGMMILAVTVAVGLVGFVAFLIQITFGAREDDHQ